MEGVPAGICLIKDWSRLKEAEEPLWGEGFNKLRKAA